MGGKYYAQKNYSSCKCTCYGYLLFNWLCFKQQSPQEKKLDKITIAEVTHSVFYAPQYAAITKGFLKKKVLKLTLLMHKVLIKQWQPLFLVKQILV